MKLWISAGALGGASILLVLGLLFLDERHLAAFEKDNILLIVAQTSAALQSGISANQLQMMQWELNDINARIQAGKEQVGDRSRKVILEARISKLVKK